MQFTLDRAKVEKRPSHNADTPYQERVVAELRHLLPDDACMVPFACGSLLIVHQGKSFGLDLATPRVPVLDAVMQAMTKLRNAGVRFEVARDLKEAFRLIREM